MKKYKNIIYIVIAIIVVGLLIYFVFIPQIKSITLLWVKNSIKQDQVSSLDQEKSQINNLKNQAKDAEDLMNVLATILPNNKDTGRFMINLEALAQDTNTDFADIKLLPPVKRPLANQVLRRQAPQQQNLRH
jgi:Tfp pilus assembly protein PilO